ncbi:hypothetical protein POPTR_019G074400v4 [Populus trichocarpa]|uniref:Uncharacterized protein n=1 Tax=Populus trichocarpa TaxID=3694 RepID=A0ACC0RKR0_POPTR|nr:uncharacterized protein LOC7475758 [Populus trichocarpa]KAI9377534.1 hypothetical protein POPTR_019G074400v4 [Populus trichocarpa]
MDSLEEKVSVFFHEDSADESSGRSMEEEDDYESDNNLHDPMETALYWESQDALLQGVLERYSSIGSKLRQEVSRVVGVAKESDFCNCMKPTDGCTSCLRQRVVNLLTQKGFEASLCTSKWKNTRKHPGGKHEYIEIIAATMGRKKPIPYLIELEFRDQFEIAKASDEYRNLVARLPEYYVGKADYLNAIVGILCDAAKRSMKEKKIHMGPWRKRSFMQMKWSNCSERRSVDKSSSKSFPSSRQAHESCLHLSAAPALTVT